MATLRQQLRTALASAYARFVELKTEHQYLGRYSVEKFDLFNQYQQTASLPRVLAVIALSPLPTVPAVVAVDRIPLNDPLLGAKHNLVAFARSAFSHTIVTYSALIIFKQALALSARDYSHAKMLLISVCTSVASESLWVTLAFTWRFPVPCREIMGLFSWSACTVLFNVVLARGVVRRYASKIIKYMPTAGIQLTLFYAFLALSLAFALIPMPAKVTMIIAFPLLKMLIKHQLWKLARQVDDLSTDVTVCMVEVSSSLYQTVCLQLVDSIPLEVLIMIMDLVQAAIEVHTYVDQDYISDGRTTMQTATNIIRSAVFPGAIERVAVGPKPRGASKEEQGRRPSLFSLSGLQSSLHQSLVRELPSQQQQRAAIKIHSQPHQQRALIFETPGQHFVGSKLVRRLQSKRSKGFYSTTSQREVRGDGNRPEDADVAAQQFYVHRKRVSKHGIRRLLDLKQIAPAVTDDLGDAADLCALPQANDSPAQDASSPADTQCAAPQTQTHVSDQLDQASCVDECATSEARHQSIREADDTRLDQGNTTAEPTTTLSSAPTLLPPVPLSRRVLPATASPDHLSCPSHDAPLAPATSTVHASLSMSADAPSALVISNDPTLDADASALAAPPLGPPARLLVAKKVTSKAVMLDGIAIQRRDQARVLEQTLQLLFSCEVLLFVEYMEVAMPLLYGTSDYPQPRWWLVHAPARSRLASSLSRSDLLRRVTASVAPRRRLGLAQ